MKSRKPLETIFMETARQFAERATCGRARVGSVITKDKRIISSGYNGPLPGQPHCSSEICDLKNHCERSIHAEANAIMFACRQGVPISGSDVYITLSPCKKCAELIILAGMKRVYFADEYREAPSSIPFLQHHGIECFRMVKPPGWEWDQPFELK